MSKRRPSSNLHHGFRPDQNQNQVTTPTYIDWQSRVFKNSFTRKGQAYTVQGWSFKVQFQGRRRTFALRAKTRGDAAQEARRLYETIRASGWEAALRWHISQRPADSEANGGRNAGRMTEELQRWRQRLVRRPYPEARLVCGRECSVRIEHDGIYNFFPLGSDDPELAARHAAEVYHQILTAGWSAAFTQHSREITMAIFWSENPLAVTYTTLYTFVNGTPNCGPAPQLVDRLHKQIAVLEPDRTARSCVRYWLDRQPGFSCPIAYETEEQLLEEADREAPAVTLINRATPEYGRLAQTLQERRPESAVFTYRLHEESDQIFISISGVSGGYLLRRRLPQALFDPLRPAAHAKSLSADEAKRHVRNYFQSFFGHLSSGVEPSVSDALTQREQEIFHQMSKGYLDKEIAHNLNLSIWTVHNHVKHIYEKLQVHNRTEAVLKYLQK